MNNNCCNAGCPRCPWKPETDARGYLRAVAAEPLTVWCETCAATVYVGHECAEGDDAE